MGKKLIAFITRRPIIQMFAALLNNLYLPGFFRGELYTGAGKMLCSPGLNCYSCPASVLACPIGSIQTLAAAPAGNFPAYVAGFIGLMGINTGRYSCGWLCPFGWLQEILHRLPGRKFNLYAPLRYVKYLVLLVFVILMPIFWTSASGLGTPAFCKYLCPAGTLEAGLPFIAFYERLLSEASYLFAAKITLLALVTVMAAVTYRPFCRILCPLGAIYAPFNRISLLRLQIDSGECVQCGSCSDACRMDISVFENPNSLECIRCYDCIRACPNDSIKWSYQIS